MPQKIKRVQTLLTAVHINACLLSTRRLPKETPILIPFLVTFHFEQLST